LRVFLCSNFFTNMVDENDKSLFRSTVEHQKPIDKDAVQSIDASKRRTNTPFQKYSFLYEPNISGSEAVIHSKSGLSPKILKKMKQGNIGSTPSIDLHGHKIEEACQSLSKFIHFHSNERFIHIIHGKGYHSDNGLSIIKSQVVYYLKQHPEVLAFCSCPQDMGGTGAVFAHLRANV
jgi:DNA-nicking Smr family endonuclease